jgi:hypothetical protein
VVVFASILIGTGVLWMAVPHRDAPPPAPAPAPQPPPVVPAPAPAPPPNVPEPLVMPVGNSPATREQLYKFAFPDHLDAVKKMLAAARAGRVAEFDLYAAWLHENKPERAWPAEATKARRAMAGEIERLIVLGKGGKDTAALEMAVDLSEKFLRTHFGYAAVHMDLALALTALNQPKPALVPAFHSIVFNPDGANGYVALGVALARNGDEDGAADAFCAVLRKSKYSDRTVAFFAKVASGEEFNYPQVTRAMRLTGDRCPKDRWGPG